MPTERPAGPLLFVGALALAACAPLIPAPSGSSVVSPPPSTRLASIAAGTTAATLAWIEAVHATDAESAARALARATRADPTFDLPWVGGTHLLVVHEAGWGPHADRHARRGVTARPDLPWTTLRRSGQRP